MIDMPRVLTSPVPTLIVLVQESSIYRPLFGLGSNRQYSVSCVSSALKHGWVKQRKLSYGHLGLSQALKSERAYVLNPGKSAGETFTFPHFMI